MVKSFFLADLKKKKYLLNKFMFRKLKEGYFISSEHGAWMFLSKQEFSDLRKNQLIFGSSLFLELEKKGFIITQDNINFIKNLFSYKINSLTQGTSLHILIPTLRCNNKCIYCHSSVKSSNSKKNFDMDFETAEKVVEFIFNSPSRIITVEFQGGDSMLNKDLFRHIVLYALDYNKKYYKKLNFALVTNLTLLDREIIEFIDYHNVALCSSLDGPKEVHNCNRFFEPSFEFDKKNINHIGKTDLLDNHGCVTEAYKILLNEYNIDSGLLMVTTKKSLTKYKEIIDEYVDLGKKTIQLKYIDKLGFANQKWKEIGYDIEEFIDFWKKSVDYIIKLNKSGIFFSERYVCLVLRKLINFNDSGYLDFRNPCGIVSGQLAYDYNGDIYACDEGRAYDEFKLGNVKENSFSDVVSSDKSVNLINSSLLENYACEMCVYRPFCGTCPVINYAENGNLIPKLPLSTKCKFNKFVFDYVLEKLLFDKEVSKIFMNWIENFNRGDIYENS